RRIKSLVVNRPRRRTPSRSPIHRPRNTRIAPTHGGRELDLPPERYLRCLRRDGDLNCGSLGYRHSNATHRAKSTQESKRCWTPTIRPKTYAKDKARISLYDLTCVTHLNTFLPVFLFSRTSVKPVAWNSQ